MGGDLIRRIFTSQGMETPVSMFLLLSAALLIASIGGIYLQDSETNDDLFRLRTLQAGSMGQVISSWEPEEGQGTLLDMLGSSDIRGIITADMKNDSEPIRYAVSLLLCSPDDLDCFLLIGEESMFNIDGDHAQWRSSAGTLVRIIVPLKRGSVEVYI